MRKVLCALWMVSVSLMCFSQREASNWYFGQNAGLDFNSGTPEFLLDGMINTVEGCEAFSDSDGNLLFYTDGNTVWNRLHNEMPNGTGLRGSFSTSQSALIVPNVQNENLYYVFTPDDALSLREGDSNGFNFSIINMAQNNGLGDVTLKNEELLPQCSEMVSAVKNSGENYYWVVTHFNDRFYSYRVDETGVDRTPVVSTVGPTIDDVENTRGSLKISPDGTKLAIAHTIVNPDYQGSFYLFDFNATTGVVSNAQLVSDSRLYYGVEFSSNSSKLYASGLNIVSFNQSTQLASNDLVQFDLDDPNFTNDEYVINSFPTRPNLFLAGALQIGIDKKIYHSIPNTHLSVIRTPNLKGINVDFRPFAVSLGGRMATYGLPPFVQSFFETIVTIQNFCEGNATTFTTDSSGGVASISWNFGDPLSGNDNLSTELNPEHTFSSFGTYTVTLDVTYNNGTTRQFLEFVEIAERPNTATEVDLIQCDIDGLDDGITKFNLMESISLFNNGNEDITALFFDNEADAMANVNQLDPIGYINDTPNQQIFARAFENAECFSIVRINLQAQPLSDLGDYGEFFICDAVIGAIATRVKMVEVYDRLRIDFQGSEEIGVFLTKEQALMELDLLDEQEHVFGPFDPLEVFFRIEEDNACAFIGRIALNVSSKPEFEELVEVNLCNGEITLDAPDGFDSYVWSNNDTQKTTTVSNPGMVEVTFANGPCAYTQTFEVLAEREIDVQEIRVEDFNRNNSFNVILGTDENPEDYVFSIDGGITFQSSPLFTRMLPGVYDVLISNGCSTMEEEIIVGGMPSFFTPNNDGANDRFHLSNPEFFPSYQMSVFNRYGKLLSSFNAQENGWDGTYGTMEMPPDDYWYVLELADGRTIKGYFTLKR